MEMRALERLGLSPAAARAYLGLLDHPADPASLPEGVADELQARGLAHRADGMLLPDSARPAVEGLVTRAQREVDEMRQAADRLAQAFDRRPGQGREAIDLVHGGPTVSAVYREMLHQTTEVMRGFDRGPYFRGEDSPDAEQRAAMARGIEFRVVYEGASLTEPEHMAGLLACREAGERSRVLPRLPMKLLISDERVAMIAMATSTGGGEALVVRPSLLLDGLLELFDQLWEAAVPVEPDGGQDESRSLLTLLAAGLTDESIARELGISVRTLQRRVSHLQRLLGASTRFQLGMQAARHGWL